MLTMYPADAEDREQEDRRGATGPGVRPKLEYLPAAESFLDPVRADADNPGAARAVVIPFGLEASVSYGGGTAAGPAAILQASQQLELYDEEFECEPYLDYGVAALRAPPIAQSIEAALDQLAAIVDTVLEEGRFPFVLGGEHALTAGAVRPFARRHPDLVVLQLDAHADLRDGYLGERYSHAAAMRRVLDLAGVSLVSVGIRAISKAEVEFYVANRDRIDIHWPRTRRSWDIEAIAAAAAGPAGLRDVRHRRAGCRGHAGDRHADARRAQLRAGAGHPAGGMPDRPAWSAPTSWSSRPSRACTPATTPPPRWPTRCCRTRWLPGRRAQ